MLSASRRRAHGDSHVGAGYRMADVFREQIAGVPGFGKIVGEVGVEQLGAVGAGHRLGRNQQVMRAAVGVGEQRVAGGVPARIRQRDLFARRRVIVLRPIDDALILDDLPVGIRAGVGRQIDRLLAGSMKRPTARGRRMPWPPPSMRTRVLLRSRELVCRCIGHFYHKVICARSRRNRCRYISLPGSRCAQSIGTTNI